MPRSETKRTNAEQAKTELLQRLLSNDKLGSLLKGFGVFVKDYESGAVIPNTLWRELGWAASDMRGDRWMRLVHPDDLAMAEDFEKSLVTGAADAWSGEFRLRSSEGEYRKIQHRALILERGGGGVPTLYVGWDMDVTDYGARIEEAQAARDDQERRYLRSETIRTAGAILSSELDPVRAAERVLAQATRVVPFDAATVWTLDGDQLLRLASRGGGPGDALRRDLDSNVNAESLRELRSPRIAFHPLDEYPSRLEVPLIVRGKLQGLLEFRAASENAFGPEETGSAMQFADHAVVALANALRYRATEIEAATDWLTGLPTRRAFMKRASRLEDEYSENEPLSALMIDIDRFKMVNDTYGHQTGDTALTAVANACREALRGQDLCCRYGGEEIAALLPRADAETAMGIGERVRRKVEALRFPDAPELKVTVSIGVGSRAMGSDFRLLIAEADEALYMAKTAGRNRCETK